MLSGIIFVNRNGLRWRDLQREQGLPKTLYSRWKRWSGMGGAQMMEGLTARDIDRNAIMIDATYF